MVLSKTIRIEQMKTVKKSFKKLDSISPSRYSAMQRCSYRVVLANTYGKPLLPYPPNSHLGNVIHECICLILTKQIQDEIAFNAVWEKLIKKEEAVLQEMGFEFLTPLKKSVKKGYAIKKLQVKSLIYSRNNLKKDKQKKHIVYDHERWMKSDDGLIVGRADLITEKGEYGKITDFKSGRIVEEEGDIKEKFEDQMKLYAYLYNEENGNFPDELSIIDLSQNEYSVEFSKEECILLAKEAKAILEETNQRIGLNQIDELAKPSHENCEFCLYKPACHYYWELGENTDSYYANIVGELSNTRQFLNGDVSATINVGNYDIVVSHFKENMLDELNEYLETKIEVFNILKSDSPDRFKASKMTKIYEK